MAVHERALRLTLQREISAPNVDAMSTFEYGMFAIWYQP
jgi:hypothetical protein